MDEDLNQFAAIGLCYEVRFIIKVTAFYSQEEQSHDNIFHSIRGTSDGFSGVETTHAISILILKKTIMFIY